MKCPDCGTRIRLLLTVDETMHVLNISRSFIYELMRDGSLESVRIGRSRRIVADSIGPFVAKLPRGDDWEPEGES